MIDSLSGEDLHKYVKDCFSYDKTEGILRWSVERPSYHFKSENLQKHWCRRYGGSVVGRVDIKGYRQAHIQNKNYIVSRLIYLYVVGSWPVGLIDHIDGDPSNNSWSNLRDVSSTENSRNLKLSKTNTSGCSGVSFQSSRGKWEAKGSVTVGGLRKRVFLGRFDRFEDAVKARKEWEDSEGNFTKRHGTLSESS